MRIVAFVTARAVIDRILAHGAIALFERIGLPRRARICNAMLAEANTS